MSNDILLGLDVGGSSIKAALVDITRGVTTTPLQSVRTPTPSTPEAVLQACAQIDRDLKANGPVGLAFPSVVQGGIARTAANVDKSWIGSAGGARLSQLIGRPVIFLNDADAAGVAEMSPGGGGRDTRGVVILLTFGTGIGSALFLDGQLVPNTELGHMEFHGQDAELTASARVRTEERLDWPAWCARVNDYLARLHALFWPDLFILGGSISEDFELYKNLLKSPTPIRRANHGAQAGVIGAAFAAAGQSQR
ncbi:MAG TPA: ROK family protein [Steroidobacteraceae bacterium]|jgi:polyphosphate glucokinase|nr:ROK family protein [Steroidobacteraceae bacterium]